ncbi:segregation/condensation protein A [Roseomonas sp. ACRSG]|nr:segregation/condensation protein A [Roseomonas sp. ACRSG]
MPEALAGNLPQPLAPVLEVEGFAGPLDFLVEMVRRERVDLRQLSILALIDQFVAALEASAARVPLEQRGNWVVLASQLVLLKSQMLAPASPAEAEGAEQAARRQLAQLEELAAMRAAANWLAARPQLGHELHARGQREQQGRPRAERILAFLEATLAMLEGRVGREAEPPATYRPPAPDLFRAPEALARLRQLLPLRPEGGPLHSFLPRFSGPAAQMRLKRRSALASTFLAGLELARDGDAQLEQAAPFHEVFIRPQPSMA